MIEIACASVGGICIITIILGLCYRKRTHEDLEDELHYNLSQCETIEEEQVCKTMYQAKLKKFLNQITTKQR